MSVTALRRPAAATPDRTAAARAELAARIKAYADAQTEIGAMEIALETGTVSLDALDAAERRAAEAREQLATAKARGQQDIIRSALGEAASPGIDAKSAAAELESAEEALVNLRDARRVIDTRLWDARDKIKETKGDIEAHAWKVARAHFAPEVPGRIDQIIAKYKEVGELSNLLNLLVGRAIDNRGPDAPANLISAQAWFFSPPFQRADNLPELSKLRAKWTAAHAALLTDANAPLPEGF